MSNSNYIRARYAVLRSSIAGVKHNTITLNASTGETVMFVDNKTDLRANNIEDIKNSRSVAAMRLLAGNIVDVNRQTCGIQFKQQSEQW